MSHFTENKTKKRKGGGRHGLILFRRNFKVFEGWDRGGFKYIGEGFLGATVFPKKRGSI